MERPYISKDKEQLTNLQKALACEILATNGKGAYASTTLAMCNTRKYHGLLVLPLEGFGGERYVLLHSLHEQLIAEGMTFNLAVKRYPGQYHPRGHKYLRRFDMLPNPSFEYQVGTAYIRKEILMPRGAEQVLIRYTLREAEHPITLRVKPFLSFRRVHDLSRANLAANTRYTAVPHGMATCMYEGFPTLHLQTSRGSEYVHAPDWHYNVEYQREAERGYASHEDLYTPGYFELRLGPGESFVFSAATAGQDPARLPDLYDSALREKSPRANMASTLAAAARQFMVERNESIHVVAGYPWFGRWGRDTLIALPDLTLTLGQAERCRAAISTLVGEMRNGLLPNMGAVGNSAYNSVDAPLWLFVAIQQYIDRAADPKKAHQEAWELWGDAMVEVFRRYSQQRGEGFGLRMNGEGLIWAGEAGYALTWMDAVVQGRPVTPRGGYDVEINALWYNAIRFLEGFADRSTALRQARLPELASSIQQAYQALFFMPQEGYLADYIDEQGPHRECRPNQILAIGLKYSPLTEEQQGHVLHAVESHLYTPLGLHTLSPRNPHYKGHYLGDQATRDFAYHQGTIWTWLLAPYLDAMQRIKGEEAVGRVSEQILTALEPLLQHDGLGSLSEIYDGDPPHAPRGTIAQAWSVSAALHALEAYCRTAEPSEKFGSQWFCDNILTTK
ncbi:MAG: amylo-alpha-1,6-glucosidase [Bacteroidia bacterium]|nr:MAG: amylo-alpha-1,6-glucosidase [Bacteroidia bacterium]